MDRHQTLIFDKTTETIELSYPPEWSEGVPSSASAKVWRASQPNDGDSMWSPSLSVDSVDTTVDAASGASQANPKTVNLTATTNIAVGRFYRLEENGRAELVKVVSITSGASVEAEFPLSYSYTTAATFKGLRQSFAVDATFIADETNLSASRNPFRVEWTYTVNSLQRRHLSFFSVSRFAKQHNLTAADLAELHGDLTLEDDVSRLNRYIDAGFERLTKDLALRRFPIERLRDSQLRDEVLRSCVLLIAAEDGIIPANRDGEAVVLERRERYYADLESMKNVIDVDQGLQGNRAGKPVRRVTFLR